MINFIAIIQKETRWLQILLVIVVLALVLVFVVIEILEVVDLIMLNFIGGMPLLFLDCPAIQIQI